MEFVRSLHPIGMRYLYILCFLSGTVLAQVPSKPARRDSVPPRPGMPTIYPRNDFYRRPGDNPNVVRATLDNMPVWGSDTSAIHMPTRGYERPGCEESLPKKKRN